MSVSIVKPRHIYKDKNNHFRLVLGVTDIGFNYIYLYRTNIYEEIKGTCIDIIDRDWYACIDRVMYAYTSDIDRKDLEDFEILDSAEYHAVIQCIHQFYTGDIVFYDEKFIYKDNIKKDKLNKPRITFSIPKTKTDDAIKEEDPIKIESIIEDNKKADVIKFVFDGKEWVEDEDNPYVNDIIAEYPPADLKEILDHARKYNIRFNIDFYSSTHEWGEPTFDLLHSISLGNSNGTPSKSRKNSRDSASNNIRNMNIRFSLKDVILLSKMSRIQASNHYGFGISEANIIIRNAKLLMGISPDPRNIYYNFTCYFNEGMTVEEVYEIYKDTISSIAIVQSNYNRWVVNSNGKNNKVVMDKWNNIINSGEIDVLIDAYFTHTDISFAKQEKCSNKLSTDIRGIIYNILCKNPFVAAGFGSISFDREALHIYASDAINNFDIGSDIVANVYEMTNKLYDVYIDSYDDHSIILANGKPIPDSIANDELLIDCYKSLLWNRFNRVIRINKRRKSSLSHIQIDALETRNTRRVALLFMVDYNGARNIINRYHTDIKYISND